MKFTDEEEARAKAIVKEGAAKARDIHKMFDQGTRGMMVFMVALGTLSKIYPGIFKMLEEDMAATLITQWIAAGEPDRVDLVPGLLLKRFGPEAYHEIEKEHLQKRGLKDVD